MDRVAVDSEPIQSIGYDLARQTLEIEFREGGGVYEYYDVPIEIYHQLMAAGSHGRYFQANIRGKYEYKKIS